MEPRTETIRARVSPRLKADAEAILHDIGLSASDAINMLYRQIVMQEGLPFEVKRPNAKTRKALKDAMRGKGLKKTTLEELRREFS